MRVLSLIVLLGSTLMSAETVASTRLPLSFEPNAGRFDPLVSFVAQAPGYGLSLEPAAVRFQLGRKGKRPAELLLRFAGAQAIEASADGPAPSRANYFLGSDATRWIRGAPQYGRVRYANLYAGISLILYENGGLLEHDFIVHPGSDPSQIALRFEGARKLERSPDGDLVVHAGGSEVTFRLPVIYQEADGRRSSVPGRYRIEDRRTVRFEIGAFDHTKDLIIDPVVTFSVNLTGSGSQSGTAVANDAQGNMYIAGITTSTDLQTLNPSQKAYGGGAHDSFVAKFDRTGKLIYCTYLGGSGDDQASALSVDSQGNVVVIGYTTSSNFPTSNGFDKSITGPYDSFVAKLDPTGSQLLYSSYVGGSVSWGLVLDSSGNAYLAGSASTGPRLTASTGAYQSPKSGSRAGFVLKLSPIGAVVYNAVIGGSGSDQAAGIDVDSTGAAYITGSTTSADFPVTPNNGVQQVFAGGTSLGDAFLAVLNPGGSQLVYSTYFGGSGDDNGTAVTVAPGIGVIIGGATNSPNLPVTPGAKQPALISGQLNGYFAVLNPPGLTLPSPAAPTGRRPTGGSALGDTSVTYTPNPIRRVYERVFAGYRIVDYVLYDSNTGLVIEVTSIIESGGRLLDAITYGPNDLTTYQPKNISGYSASGYIDITNDAFAHKVLPQSRTGLAPDAAAAAAPALGLRLSFPEWPTIPPAGVVNAASYATPSTVAPGEIVTLFGSNLGPTTIAFAQFDSSGNLSTSVATTQVLFGGYPAPVVYTLAGQVAVIVPYEVQGQTSINVIPAYNAVLGNITAVNVASVAPGIFSINQAGTGQGAIQIANTAIFAAPAGSISGAQTRPAQKGEYLTIYCAGLGAVTNQPATGAVALSSPLSSTIATATVSIGGVPATVSFAGLSPGFVGLYQVNAQVPANAPSGSAVALTVSIGGSTSNTVTIAVQ